MVLPPELCIPWFVYFQTPYHHQPPPAPFIVWRNYSLMLLPIKSNVGTPNVLATIWPVY